MFFAGKWCAYEITLICAATLASVVIMYVHAQSAYGVRVPKWLLKLTFVADTLDKDSEHTMPTNTVDTKVCFHSRMGLDMSSPTLFHNQCICIHLEQHNSCAMPVECKMHTQDTRRRWNGSETVDVLGTRVLPTRLYLSALFSANQLWTIHSVVLWNEHIISVFRHIILLLCSSTVYYVLVFLNNFRNYNSS